MQRDIKYPSHKTGLPPGELVHVGQQKNDKVIISLIRYNEYEWQEYEIKSPADIPVPDPKYVTWLNIDGLHDVEIIKIIGDHFNLHPLLLEDLLNTHQRPKIDILDDYIYIIFKTLEFNKKTSRVSSEQISIFFNKHYMISFQEFTGDLFNGIRERIRQNKGRLRKTAADCLTYSILDVTIDYYFEIIEALHEKIDILQQGILVKKNNELPKLVHNIRQQTLSLRRASWPVRQIIDQLQKSESEFIDESLMPYLRDAADHIVRITEAIDSIQNTLDNIMETYLSLNSQKTNEAMRILTVVTTIFMPPTLIAGIYGMNFEYMPELHWTFGYPMVWVGMLSVGVAMLWYFRKKDWL
jgi:magnesium transporter